MNTEKCSSSVNVLATRLLRSMKNEKHSAFHTKNKNLIKDEEKYEFKREGATRYSKNKCKITDSGKAFEGEHSFK